MKPNTLGYQYAVFYDADTSRNASIRYVSVARREMSDEIGQWEKLSLTDYNQTDDDGHDMSDSALIFILLSHLLKIKNISWYFSGGWNTTLRV